MRLQTVDNDKLSTFTRAKHCRLSAASHSIYTDSDET